ncbi:MAG TPA: hypothetical protein VFL80_00795, partial [Thermoanaerobaculia bacterium]|nr:hypothetical protein [Thermoanaerobaculia bacterium]
GFVQFTIEERRLTTEFTPPLSVDPETRRTTVEARDAADALDQFVQGNDSELVSVTQPVHRGEAIATVRKCDDVFLVRVYGN